MSNQILQYQVLAEPFSAAFGQVTPLSWEPVYNNKSLGLGHRGGFNLSRLTPSTTSYTPLNLSIYQDRIFNILRQNTGSNSFVYNPVIAYTPVNLSVYADRVAFTTSPNSGTESFVYNPTITYTPVNLSVYTDSVQQKREFQTGYSVYDFDVINLPTVDKWTNRPPERILSFKNTGGVYITGAAQFSPITYTPINLSIYQDRLLSIPSQDLGYNAFIYPIIFTYVPVNLSVYQDRVPSIPSQDAGYNAFIYPITATYTPINLTQYPDALQIKKAQQTGYTVYDYGYVNFPDVDKWQPKFSDTTVGKKLPNLGYSVNPYATAALPYLDKWDAHYPPSVAQKKTQQSPFLSYPYQTITIATVSLASWFKGYPDITPPKVNNYEYSINYFTYWPYPIPSPPVVYPVGPRPVELGSSGPRPAELGMSGASPIEAKNAGSGYYEVSGSFRMPVELGGGPKRPTEV